jgi:hypothetical protein
VDQDSDSTDAHLVSIEQKLIELITQHVPASDPAVLREQKHKLPEAIQALASRAETGHLQAGKMMLGIAIMVLADPRVEVSDELRRWLCQMLGRLLKTPSAPGVQAIAPRGVGRPPLYSDDLMARLRFEEVQFMACAFARAAKSFGYKADAAFDRAAEMLTSINCVDPETGEVTKANYVDPKTGKPYTGAAVKGWFYTNGHTFDS